MKALKIAALISPVLLLAGVSGWLYLKSKQPLDTSANNPHYQQVNEAHRPHLARLGSPPDWESLQAYQGAVSKEEFVNQLKNTYSLGSGWKQFIKINDHQATIKTGPPQKGGKFILEFANSADSSKPPRPWRSPSEIPASPDPKRPLLGFRIAIDPGHIGGHFAALEAREFRINGGKPVREGEMTLKVAYLLKKRLEKLGATVFLTRSNNRPVTKYRPSDFKREARKDTHSSNSSAREQQELANLYFYRVSEIRSRAELLRTKFKPDLTLCLHFNAEAWGDPARPQLSTRNHLHLLINGAYGANELAQEDQRFEMLERLLQGCHKVESELAIPIANHFSKKSGLPPFRYSSKSMTKPTESTFVWKRNLLANRIFPSPVLYFEPYVMNTQDVYDRVMAGDYQGNKTINGLSRPSIFREYANSVADGLVIAITQVRKNKQAP